MVFDVFLMLLLLVSVLTSLVVEGIKKFLGDMFNYIPTNLTTGIVAIVLGALVGIFYYISAEIAFTIQVVVTLIALVFLSWLCSMIGYDKVVQAITQIKKTNTL